MALLLWLAVGLLLGALEMPYQLLSQLGFELQQRLWLQVDSFSWAGAALVFAAALAMLLLAWGPLASARGGGLTPVLALQRGADEASTLERLDLRTQLRRLPLMVLTHLAGFTVGVESPSAALGAALLLALRRRWPAVRPWAALPIPLVAAIGGGAGLGAAFRSPLLGAAYAIEELSREQRLSLVLPTLLLAGSGAAVATKLGQPARLAGLNFGVLSHTTWPWAVLLTLLGAVLGSLFVRLLIALAGWLGQQLRQRHVVAVVAVAAALTLLACLSGGLSLNDGSLSLAAALQGDGGGGLATLLWRLAASQPKLAQRSCSTMTLGSLLASPLTFRPAEARGQLAAIGAVAFFAAANRTPLFCALFVFTLQGDPQLLLPLLLASGVSTALAERWRGLTWNEAQGRAARC